MGATGESVVETRSARQHGGQPTQGLVGHIWTTEVEPGRDKAGYGPGGHRASDDAGRRAHCPLEPVVVVAPGIRVEHDQAAMDPFGSGLPHDQVPNPRRGLPVDPAQVVAGYVLALGVELKAGAPHRSHPDVLAESAGARQPGERKGHSLGHHQHLVGSSDADGAPTEAEQITALQPCWAYAHSPATHGWYPVRSCHRITAGEWCHLHLSSALVADWLPQPQPG